MSFGMYLKIERIQKYKKIGDFINVGKLGVTTQWISTIENSIAFPSTLLLKKICRCLDLDFHECGDLIIKEREEREKSFSLPRL